MSKRGRRLTNYTDPLLQYAYEPAQEGLPAILQALSGEFGARIRLPLNLPQAAAAVLGTPVGTGSNTGQAAKTLLFDTVIELLAGRVAQ